MPWNIGIMVKPAPPQHRTQDPPNQKFWLRPCFGGGCHAELEHHRRYERHIKVPRIVGSGRGVPSREFFLHFLFQNGEFFVHTCMDFRLFGILPKMFC